MRDSFLMLHSSGLGCFTLKCYIVHGLDIQVSRSWVDYPTYTVIVLDFSVLC